ncbi:MAG: molybdopterin cofactor-binding domain-containing protein [Sphingomonadaceae bacterium]
MTSGTFEISRRTLLVGGGAGIGLVVAYALWPRQYEPNVRAAPGETRFNAFLKIGNDGRVIAVVPQIELGQGVYTSLPQILADELGADWRTVAVEPAPISPLYANHIFASERARNLPSPLQGIGRWAAEEYATRSALMMTGGSTSIRAFEPRLREAGAAGRALLSMAAAERWNVDWRLLDTAKGFVVHGDKRIAFGELAEAAAGHELPDVLPSRAIAAQRLAGRSLPRIDIPAKLDGSAQYAADIRLPDMVYASVRQGPFPDSELIGIDREAAGKIAGVLAIVEAPHWAAVAATNWWAADRAAKALRPRFRSRRPLADDDSISGSLEQALEDGKGQRVFTRGDIGKSFAQGRLYRARYQTGLAANAPIEPLAATASVTGDRLEIWAPAQLPGFALRAAARAAGVSESGVTFYPVLAGGGYGRKAEVAAVEQAAHIAAELKRPVQLMWSRSQETRHDSFRPAARAQMIARMGENGLVSGWQARIAVPSAGDSLIGRLTGGGHEGGGGPDASAADGAVPPYDIAAVAIDHLPADIGLATGLWRGGAHSYTAFFTESFVDELAREADVDPLSFRMQMLNGNPRLARALSNAAALGGWDGGARGSTMGIAAHSAFGSHIACLVEIEIGEAQRIGLRRVTCAIDCGRAINPAIVRRQIEGGVIHAMSGATGAPIAIARGMAGIATLEAVGLPTLADAPDILVDIAESDEDPGGVTELGVAPVAPAIANAVHAATGQRLRSLPLRLGGIA